MHAGLSHQNNTVRPNITIESHETVPDPLSLADRQSIPEVLVCVSMTEAPCVCILFYVNNRGAKVYRLKDQEASGLRVVQVKQGPLPGHLGRDKPAGVGMMLRPMRHVKPLVGFLLCTLPVRLTRAITVEVPPRQKLCFFQVWETGHILGTSTCTGH